MRKKKVFNGEVKKKEYNSNEEASVQSEDERRRSKMSDDIDTEVKHRHFHRSMKQLKKEKKDGDYSSDYEQDSFEENNQKSKNLHKKKRKDNKKPKSGQKLSKIKLNGSERSIDSANKSRKSSQHSMKLDSKSVGMIKNAIHNIEAFEKAGENNAYKQKTADSSSLKINNDRIGTEENLNEEVNEEKKDAFGTNNKSGQNSDEEKVEVLSYKETIDDLTYILIKSVYREIEREGGDYGNRTDDFCSEEEV